MNISRNARIDNVSNNSYDASTVPLQSYQDTVKSSNNILKNPPTIN